MLNHCHFEAGSQVKNIFFREFTSFAAILTLPPTHRPVIQRKHQPLKEYPLRTVIFIPPLPRISGGLAVLLRVAEHLHQGGHKVHLALRESTTGLRAALPPQVPCLEWDHLNLCPNDCWLVPEGWPNALLMGLQAQARCVVYVQNWAYLLSNLPENTFWDQLPVRFLAVSEPVRQFIQHTTGIDAPILRPAIDSALFSPPVGDLTSVDLSAPVTGPLRICYMPRKNPALARQIRDAFTARLHHCQRKLEGQSTLSPQDIEWQEIHHKSPQEVAALLRSSHIFLATGFPEGCPLPPLEAMACGCIVAGFAGRGGWDYMRQAAPCSAHTNSALHAPYAHNPWFDLRPVPWGGNGFYAEDADVLGAACALEDACTLLRQGGSALTALRHAAAQTSAAYSPEQQAESIATLWQQWL